MGVLTSAIGWSYYDAVADVHAVCSRCRVLKLLRYICKETTEIIASTLLQFGKQVCYSRVLIK